MATRIGMTDKERLADMMNPDSNADYNSPNAFKAMEDHIKENAQYYPAQAAMLADGGHVTGMHVSDGTDGNPAGSLIVAIGNDQDGKAGREKYHIVCERGTQDGISRTMGNKVIDFKDMNNEPMPAHKYDDAGIRRDGINPLTHSGYWEEES